MNAKPISESSTPGCSKWLALIFGTLFLLLGLVLFGVLFINPIRSHLAAQSWPTTQCQIISSTVEVRADSESTSYSPVIKYRYTVDGRTLEGDRISFTQSNTSNKRSWARSVCRKFPLGSTPICSYEPHEPGRSVLDLEFFTFDLAWLFAAVVFARRTDIYWTASFQHPKKGYRCRCKLQSFIGPLNDKPFFIDR